MDQIEKDMLNMVGQKMFNLDQQYQSGSEKSGLKSSHTKQLYKTIANSKKGGGNVPAPRSSSIPLGALPPQIPADGGAYAPVDITPEMLAEIEDYEKHNPNDIAPDLGNVHVDAHAPIHPMVTQPPQIIHAAQPPKDDRQMEFNFEMIRADSVYKELTEVKKDVTVLKEQNEKIMKQLTFLLESVVEPQE